MSGHDVLSGLPSIEGMPQSSSSSSLPSSSSSSTAQALSVNTVAATKSQSNTAHFLNSLSNTTLIPRLSAATTELLARVTGNIKKDPRDTTGFEESQSLNQPNPFSFHNRTQGFPRSFISQDNKMRKISSAFVELPEPPFYFESATPSPTSTSNLPAPHAGTRSVPSKLSAPARAPQPIPRAKSGLVPIAPKPAAAPAPTLQPEGPVHAPTPTASAATAPANSAGPASKRQKRAAAPTFTLQPEAPVQAPVPASASTAAATSTAKTSKRRKPWETPPLIFQNKAAVQALTTTPATTTIPVGTTAPVATTTPLVTTTPVSTTTRVNTAAPVVTTTPIPATNPFATTAPVVTAPVASTTPLITTAAIVTTTSVGTAAPVPATASIPTTAPIAITAPVATAPVTSTSDTSKRQKAAAAPRQSKGTSKGSKQSRKRKRGSDDDEDVIKAADSSSDESDDVAPTATQTKSGRQVNRPALYVPPASIPAGPKPVSTASGSAETQPPRKRKKVYRKGKEPNIICSLCERGNSPSNNVIVFCDGCNTAWHQHCHDPRIDNEYIRIKEKQWLCKECNTAQQPIQEATSTNSEAVVNNEQPQHQRPPMQPALASTQPVVTNQPHQQPPVPAPAPAQPTKVGAESFLADERRGYLSGLSHSSLVELLMAISDKHPSVPMFPANLRDQRLSKFPFQPTASKAPTATILPTNGSSAVQASQIGGSTGASVSTTAPTPTGPSAGNSARGEALASNPLTGSESPGEGPSSRKRRRQYESDEESEWEQFEEHRLYPRAGNGFALSQNPEDLDILREDVQCPTFSHAVHGVC